MTKTYYMNQGSTFSMTDDHSLKIQNELPPGHYSLMASMEGLFLQIIPKLNYTGRIYGDVEKRADRIIATYLDREQNTGVLLEGEKGAGKTLLLKILASKLLDLGISTIVINMPIAGDGFNQFISKIQQPCLILFDEFEKTYPQDKQEGLLTLFDGLYHSKKLFAVSINDYNKLLGHLKNRPGRMYYHFKYESLDEATITQYVKENLKNKSKHDETILSILSVFQKINFDMLKALVEEMNRYDESLKEVVNYVNAAPQESHGNFKVVEFLPKNDKFKSEEIYPLNDSLQSISTLLPFRIQYVTLNNKGKSLSDKEKDELITRLQSGQDKDRDWAFVAEGHIIISPSYLVGLKNSIYTYDTPDWKVKMERQKQHAGISWRDAL